MVRDCLGLSLSIFFILLSLPFLAVSFLLAALCTAVAALFPRFHRQRHADVVNLSKLQPVDEFGFENALGAYEELIRTHAWRKQ
jgi:hypothetical protein